jgi:predicted transcriptional regulator
VKKLEVRIGEPLAASLARFGKAMTGVKAGRAVKPFFGIGFRTMVQFGEMFTPKRWELVEVLKKSGPLSIYALAKRLDRHYRNVHKDVTALMEWTVIEKNHEGRVFVPWDEIDVRWPLQAAA